MKQDRTGSNSTGQLKIGANSSQHNELYLALTSSITRPQDTHKRLGLAGLSLLVGSRKTKFTARPEVEGFEIRFNFYTRLSHTHNFVIPKLMDVYFFLPLRVGETLS